MDLITILLTTALGFLLPFLLGFCLKRWRHIPPGPWGLPLVGYYPFLTSCSHKHLSQLSNKYGDVMSLNIAGKLFIHLNGPDVIKEALVTRADEFNGKPREMNLLTWLDGGGLGIAQEEGAVWKEHRRFFLRAAKNFGFGKIDLEIQMHEEMHHLLQDLRCSNGDPVDLFHHMSYTSSSLISQILFKKQFNKDDPVLREITHGLNVYMSHFLDERGLLVGPIFQYIVMKLFPWGRKLQQTRGLLHDAINKFVDGCLTSFRTGNNEHFVDTYLEERKCLEKKGELEKSSFSIDRLRALSINMFVEAAGTNTLCYILKAMSNHGDEQEKAQKEIDEVVGTSRLPSWLDKPNLPYTDALIQELIRTNHPINFTTLYSNFETTTLRGYIIPKRSVIIGNLWSIHNDPKLFPNPSKFDPGRFLGPDGKRIKIEGPYTFGIGKRSCIAESFAQMEIFLIVSAILQNFTLLPVDELKPNAYEVRAISRK